MTQHSLLERDSLLLAGAIISGLALFFSLRTGRTIPTPVVFYQEDNPVLFLSTQSITFCIFASCVLGLVENSGWL